ncbi:MAG: penicillin-binding protein 1C, partial [Acidobacteria bacterium]|nr:penicillin-binding protein 1C [Acidobacteriota bacterium]
MKRLARFVAARRVRRLVGVLGVITSGTALWVRLGPIDPALLDDRSAVSTAVVDRRGTPLYEALSGDGTRSLRLSADTIPPSVAAATIAAEDRRFTSHPGIDPVALLRAVKRNLAERRTVEGGSTISQQVAKLLLNRQAPSRARGMHAKISEAVLALRIEHRFGKREILAMYLNLAAYGSQLTGVERASREYFGCTSAMLTPAQAAILAGLPQRPSGFNPYRNRATAIARQRSVLRRMEMEGALTAAQAEEARAEQLVFTSPAAAFAAPHFVEMALASAGDERPARIETTLDGELQADVAGIIRTHRKQLERHGAANVAVVVLDNARGEWIAWEGSGNYFDGRGGAINGPVSPRQPGSALKPFTYALAFEEGHTPASVLPDVPSHFPTAEAGVLYSPRNYDGRYRGPLLARTALAGSENVPAVALGSEIGVPKLLRFLMRAGLTTFDHNASHYGLGVTLGNAEVRLDELVAAYAAFARGGEWLEPVFRARMPQARRTVVSPRTAFWITDVLSDAAAREYIFGRGGSLEFPFAVAVKTGTSQAYHDNWAIGYTRDVTVGVWVGNFDRTPLRDSTGVTGAGPIFHAVMLAARQRAGSSVTAGPDDRILSVPAGGGLEARDICALSGMTANAWCPSRAREWMPGSAERLPCSWHHLSDGGVLTIWPPEYRQWARQQGRTGDSHLFRGQPPLLTRNQAQNVTSDSPAATKKVAVPK